MKRNENGRSPFRLPLIIIGLVILYAYAFQVTQVDFQEPLKPQRQENLISLIRSLARPDLVAYETDTRSTNVSLLMPCPDELKGSQVTFEGRQAVLIPNCVSTTQDGLQLTGSGFQGNVEGAILWLPNGANTPRRVAEFRADETGAFVIEFTMPDVRPSEEPHRLEIVEVVDRRAVGLSDTAVLGLEKILETVLMALMASTIGTVLAIPISFMAARNLMRDVKLPLASIMLAIIVVPLVAGGVGWLTQQLLSVVGLTTLKVGGDDLNFVSNFLVVLFELFVILLPALVAFVLAILSVNWAARVGQRIIMGMDEGTAKGVTAVLTGLGTAVFILLMGYFLILTNLLGVRELVPETVAGQFNLLLWPSVIVGVIVGALTMRQSAKTHYAIGLTIYSVTRGTLNILRSIEPIMMGFVFVVWVGLGPFVGILALTLHSIADLGKLFSEQVENIDEGPREAITATGANSVQTIVYSVVPQVTPHYIAYIFYRWDINVRMSTIIGFVGGGGIGFVLQRFLNQLQYTRASVMVIAIAVVVTVLDFISSRIRSRIT